MSGDILKLKLVLPLPVSINNLYINQFSYNPKTRSRTPTGKRIMSAEGKKVKQQIISETKKQMKTQVWEYELTKSTYLYLDTYIYMNRLGRDDNNIYKLLNDSLEKIVYDNDSRILTRTQKILIDSENPRVEVELRQVDYIGIFENEELLHKFENKCMGCKRYKRNCSILSKAKEGRIQEDINEKLECSKYNPQ